MGKIVKKLKIKTLLLFLVILSVLATSMVGVMGVTSLYKMNDNTEGMYKNNLLAISKLGEVRGALLNVRLSINKAMNHYEGESDNSVKDSINNLNTYLNQYAETKLEDFETKKLSELKQEIDAYEKTWEKIREELINSGEPTEANINELNGSGGKLESIAVELVDFNEKAAETVNKNNTDIFLKSIKNFLIIMASSLILVILVSIIVIGIITRALKETIENLNVIATGDLTQPLKAEENNEFGVMKRALNKSIEDIRLLVTKIKDQSMVIEAKAIDLGSVSEEMASAAENVATTVQGVAQGASSQASDLMTINEILEEFGESIEEIASSIDEVGKNANGVQVLAKDSSKKLKILESSVNTVGSSSKELKNKVDILENSMNKISEITDVINSISGQTNLLALNASIEAARAGEAGRGFAVVADEIRKLAEKSKVSSDNIAKLVNNISRETKDMVSTSNIMSKEVDEQIIILKDNEEAFMNIIEAVNEVAPKMQAINNSVVGINKEKDVIADKIGGASSIAEEVAASSEEIAASTEEMNASTEEVSSAAVELSHLTQDILELINKFKV